MNGSGKKVAYSSKRTKDLNSKMEEVKSISQTNSSEPCRGTAISPKNNADEIYNVYLASSAAELLLKKPEQQIREDIDKQLTALQKRVKESLDELEETRQKMGSLCVMSEQTELLQFQNDMCETFSDEPAFVKGKNFTELMNEIDKIRNQLPTENIIFPDSKTDIAEFQNATSKLLQSLDCMCAGYGAQQTSTAASAGGLQKVKNIREMLENSKASANIIVPKASACVLNDIVSTVDIANLPLGPL